MAEFLSDQAGGILAALSVVLVADWAVRKLEAARGRCGWN